MANLPKVFAALALFEESSAQLGRADALRQTTKLYGTKEDQERATAEYLKWNALNLSRRRVLIGYLERDYLS